jgi:hypothetical protein
MIMETFQVGQEVKIIRKVASFSDGWRNSWVSDMDQAVGKIGKIVRTDTGMGDYQIQIPGIVVAFGYPPAAFELVETPAPVESKFGFKIGQRVLVTKYNEKGTVTGFSGRFINVQRDNYVGNDPSGWFSFNLKPLDETPVTPAPQPPTAVSATVVNRPAALQLARQVAVEAALHNHYKRVNMDVVQKALAERGIDSTVLGNAAGSVFSGKDWKNTQTTVKSEREGNRGRRIIVWEYVGDKREVVAPTPKFIVQFNMNGTWVRSGNTTGDGIRLKDHEFTTREEAQQAVDEQNARKSYQYRVTQLGETK